MFVNKFEVQFRNKWKYHYMLEWSNW